MVKPLNRQQVYEHERAAQNAWAKRDLQTDKLLEATYQESIRRMQDQIDRFYIKYASNKGLTRAEANRRIKHFDVQAWAEKAAEAVKNKDFSPYTNDWLKTYNTKMYISRIELMKAALELELQNLYSAENKIMDKHLVNEALAEYRRQAGILGSSAKGSSQRIRQIVDADFYGNNFSERIWGRTGHYMETRKAVFGSLNRMYTDMMGYKQERSRLMKQFNVSYSEAMRLLRTETARVRADSEVASYKDNGATHYIYCAEPGACINCAALDGMAIPVEEAEKGLTMFPMHPNCRCSSYGHIEMEYKDGRSTLDEFKRWESLDIEKDSMAKKKRFEINIDNQKIHFSTRKVKSDIYDIWSQGTNKSYRDTRSLIENNLKSFDKKEVPRTVIVNRNKFPGYAAYDHTNDVLFVSNQLNSEEAVEKILEGNYFAAKSMKDILIHELAHKKHWDAAKRLNKTHPKWYNTVEDAKRKIDDPIRKYILNQILNDKDYLKGLSPNAQNGFSAGEINEIVAEVFVKKHYDIHLTQLVKEVLSDDVPK